MKSKKEILSTYARYGSPSITEEVYHVTRVEAAMDYNAREFGRWLVRNYDTYYSKWVSIEVMRNLKLDPRDHTLTTEEVYEIYLKSQIKEDV